MRTYTRRALFARLGEAAVKASVAAAASTTAARAVVNMPGGVSRNADGSGYLNAFGEVQRVLGSIFLGWRGGPPPTRMR